MALLVTMPVPPSTNNLFANVAGRGRVKSKRYLTWLRAAGNEILAQRPLKRVSGPVDIHIVCRRSNVRRDLDNAIKAPIDLLVEFELIDDDRDVRRIIAEWSDEIEHCEVTIRPATAVAARGARVAA